MVHTQPRFDLGIRMARSLVWVLAAGVGLALLGQGVRGAAILEDHSSTWTSAG